MQTQSKMEILVDRLRSAVADESNAEAAQDQARLALEEAKEEYYRARTAVLNADQALNAHVNETVGRFAK